MWRISFKNKKMGSFNKVASLCLLLSIVIHNHRGSDAARILGIFPLPAKSHSVMTEALMRGLAARGHQVDVLTPFPVKNPPPNYRDISLAGVVPVMTNNLTLTEAEKFTSGTLRQMIYMAGYSMCKILDSPLIRDIIENPPTDPPYDLVIYEAFAADCFMAFGRHLNVPVVGVMTSKFFDWMNQPMGNPPSTAFVPHVFAHYGQRMSFFERLTNTLVSAYLRSAYWYYTSDQLPIIEKQFGLKLASSSELQKDVALMLVNTHPSFDFIRPMTPAIVEVGGLHIVDGDLDLAPEVKKWLDDSKHGCVYFSFGSMVKIESFPIETVKAFYGAFERIAPVRVLMKIAKSDELPSGIPKNVMIYPWLPQTRVLSHKNVKAFVTHSGLMSTQEAVHYGVPMIGVPIFGDQFLNIRLSVNKKIAVATDYKTLTTESFTNDLNTVLKNPSYSENAKRLSKLWNDRPKSAMDTATFWTEYVIRNGNVLRSPAADLSWWQLELLDVYACLIAITALVLYIVKRLIGFLFGLFFSKSAKQNAQKSHGASKSKKNK